MDKVLTGIQDSCPMCGHTLDAASTLHGGTGPQPDDASVCIACGGLLVYGEDMKLRLPTAEEQLELMTYPDVMDTLKAWRAVFGKLNG